jgi:hypothetical protein
MIGTLQSDIDFRNGFSVSFWRLLMVRHSTARKPVVFLMVLLLGPAKTDGAQDF